MIRSTAAARLISKGLMTEDFLAVQTSRSFSCLDSVCHEFEVSDPTAQYLNATVKGSKICLASFLGLVTAVARFGFQVAQHETAADLEGTITQADGAEDLVREGFAERL